MEALWRALIFNRETSKNVPAPADLEDSYHGWLELFDLIIEYYEDFSYTRRPSKDRLSRELSVSDYA
jgi:hypothetical protein